MKMPPSRPPNRSASPVPAAVRAVARLALSFPKGRDFGNDSLPTPMVNDRLPEVSPCRPTSTSYRASSATGGNGMIPTAPSPTSPDTASRAIAASNSPIDIGTCRPPPVAAPEIATVGSISASRPGGTRTRMNRSGSGGASGGLGRSGCPHAVCEMASSRQQTMCPALFLQRKAVMGETAPRQRR